MELLKKGDVKTTIIAGIIFGVIICIIFYVTLYKSRSNEILEKQKELQEKQIKLQEAQKIAQQLDKLQRENRKLEYEIRESAKRLPQEKEIPDLLRQITNLGNRAQIDFVSFKPQTVEAKGFYKEIPIRVNVRSSYHNLGLFLSELGQLERIVNTSDIQIQPLAGKKGESVSSSFLITTFTFAEGGGV